MLKTRGDGVLLKIIEGKKKKKIIKEEEERKVFEKFRMTKKKKKNRKQNLKPSGGVERREDGSWGTGNAGCVQLKLNKSWH